MEVAADTLFDLAQFVVRVKVFFGFDIAERHVNRGGFAGDIYFVRNAGFARIFARVVAVVRGEQYAPDSAQQVIGIVARFECFGNFLQQDFDGDFLEAFNQYVVRNCAAPDARAQEGGIHQACFGAAVEECRRLRELAQHEPLLDGNIDVVLVTEVGELANHREGVLREVYLADILVPFFELFLGDGEAWLDVCRSHVFGCGEQRAQALGRDAVGQRYRERELVDDVAAGERHFGADVARDDEGDAVTVLERNLHPVLHVDVARVVTLENDDVVIAQPCGDFLLAAADLERLRVLERGDEPVEHDGLARTGAPVDVERFADNHREEGELDTVFAFRNADRKFVHQFGYSFF